MMKTNFPAYFGLVLFWFFVSSRYASCVASQVDPPCTFVISNKNYDDFSIPNSFIVEMQICASPARGGDVVLRLENCSLPAFPDKVFSNLGFVDRFTLELTKKTSIQILAPEIPSHQPFVNMQFGSAIFEITDAVSMAGWQWSVLSNLKPKYSDGVQFIAVDTELAYLRSDFGRVAGGQVTLVRILRCGLRWLGSLVFAPFRNLRTLELRDNKIESIERSHLPSVALQFSVIDLGKNKLTHIPQDLFSNFKLRVIYLDGNKILIPLEHINTILSVDHFKLDSDLIWPCNCDAIFKLKEKFKNTFQQQSCMMENKYTFIENFLSVC